MFVIASSVVFLTIMAGQIMMFVQNYRVDHNHGNLLFPDSIFIDFLELLVPNFYSWGCFFYIFSVFMLSLVLFKTRQFEEEEALHRDINAKSFCDPVENIENMRNYQIQRAVQLIKDFKFKNHICLQIEIVLLMMISSLACNIIVLPYAFIFILLGLVMAISNKQSSLRSASNKLNLVLLAFLLVDLPGRYIIKATQLLNGESDATFYTEITGLLTTTPTYVDFYAKILLLLLECQKLQYCYDYSTLYEQIRSVHSDKQELQRLFRKKKSLTFKVLKPISLFMFCTMAIIFSLFHPSIILFCCMPLFIFGYFRSQNQYVCLSKFFIFLIGFYVFCYYVYNITTLLLPSSQTLETWMTYFEKICGYKRDPEIFEEIFPGQIDYIFYIIMAAFTMFIAKADTSHYYQADRMSQLIRGGMDEDILTNYDEMSEAKSKFSVRQTAKFAIGRENQSISERSYPGAGGYQRMQKQPDIQDIILEDRKEEEGEQEGYETGERKSVQSYARLSHKSTIPGQYQKAYQLQRDDTMRGKMKRCCYKLYQKLQWVLEYLIELAIIHSTKIALIALFCVSVFQVNVLNAIFFILFLVLSMTSYSNLKTYWTLPCIYNSIIILTLYAYDVFCPDGIQGVDTSVLQLIGIVSSDSSENYMIRYIPYLLLMVVLILNSYVIYSKRYEFFLDEITKLETTFAGFDQNQDFIVETEQNERKSIRDKQFLKADLLTKIIVQYAVYLLILALYLECSMIPVSALNFILLLLMTVVVFKYLYSPSQIKMYQNMKSTLLVLKYVSLVFIFLKYMFQFEEFADNSEAIGEAKSYYQSIPTLQILLGIENTYVPAKLFCLALVMGLSNFQLKFLTQKYLYEVLKEEDSDWNRTIFMDSAKKNAFSVFWHYFMIYFIFVIYNLFIFLPLIIVIVISLSQISILGCLMLITTIIVMYRQRDTYWDYSFQPIGVVSSIAMLSIYLIQILYLCLPSDLDFLERLGVSNEIDQEGLFYSQYLPCFFVILSCILQKITHKCKPLFKQTVFENELDKNVLSLQELNIILEDNEQSEKESQKSSEPKIPLQSPQLGKEQSKLIKEAIYEYETPIRQCLELKAKYAVIFFHSCGLILFNFMSLITMLAKLNVSSIIYSIVYVLILKQRYYPNRFQETLHQKSKREKVNYYLKVQLALISIMIIEEYSVTFINTYFDDYYQWKDTLLAKICFDKSEGCILEWNQWFSLSDFPISWITLDYFYLLVCYVNLYFTSGQIYLQEELMLEQPKVNDKNDFLSETSVNNFTVLFTKVLFEGFPFFLILYLIILACLFHGKGMTDMLSIVYLFFAFFYIMHTRRFFSKNSALLQPLRNYNIVVLYSIILFQIPVFVCPAPPVNDDYYYIKQDECAQIMKNYDNRVTEYGNNSWMAFYIVFTQSVGFYKVYGILQLDFILLIVITEIQNQLFQHPYFRVYVLQHMSEGKETDGRLRAFMFVERTHLNVTWTYKTIKEEIKILHTKLQRIISTNKDLNVAQDSLLQMQDSPDKAALLEDEERERNEEEGKMQEGRNIDEKEIEKMMETHAVQIENYAMDLLERPGAPVIPLKMFIETFKSSYQSASENRGEDLSSSFEEKLDELVVKLQRQVHNTDRINLYKKEGIGLNFALPAALTYLKESEFRFFQELIYREAYASPERQTELNKSLDIMEQSFLVKQHYEEGKSMIVREPAPQKASLMQKASLVIKNFLWTKAVDRILLYTLTQLKKRSKKGELTPEKIPFLSMLGYSVLSQSENICYCMIFIHFLVSTNILSFVLPLTALIYALIDSPIPNIKYWKFLMMYMFLTIILKFTYQLPIFCGTPPYHLFSLDSCIDSYIGPEILVTRIDYIIGIHKYSGPASYPMDQGIFRGIISDIFVLLALMLHKNYLIQMGIWHFVKVQNNIYVNPSFKCKVEDLTPNERIDHLRRENYRIYEYEQKNVFVRMGMNVADFFVWVKSLTFKILPRYMNPKQRNIDIEKQHELPYITHNVVKVKPGKNYFSEQFFILLIILFYVLFFYKNITGESQNSSLSGVSLQRFSVFQVFILFFILILMAVERMLFKSRQMYSSGSQTNHGILIKHSLAIKLGIHIVLVLCVHIMLGFIVPSQNRDKMSSRFPLVLCYLLCVVYFVFSALQIKHGFQQRPYKPPFVKDVDGLTVMAFRIYKSIPFVWEMKVILDWTVTKTCLDLFQWFKIDDAVNYLYFNRYQNNGRLNNPEFAPQQISEKFFKGFCFAFGLILLILIPIMIFSGITPIMVKNPVLSGVLWLQIEMNSNGNQYNILTSQAFNIQPLTGSDISSIETFFQPINQKFEADYMQKMSFSPYSQQEWTISPPSITKMVNDYYRFKDQKYSYVEVRSQWSFNRDNPVGAEVAQGNRRVRLELTHLQPIIDLITNNNTLNGTIDSNLSSLFVEELFPKFLKLGSTQASSYLEVFEKQNMSAFSSVNLTLNKDDDDSLYWTFQLSPHDLQGVFSSEYNAGEDRDMVIVVYNEEVVGSFFGSSMGSLSVMGLYVTVVYTIGSLVRLVFDRISQRVIYEEMPNPDRLFEICEGIFIAQLEGDLHKEKMLYDLLIRIYRSPEYIIKITGNKLQYRDNNASKKPKKIKEKQL